jgi:hypothetical protein
MENNNKKLLLLDLDNTIICAEELPNNDEKSLINDKLKEARKKFRTVRMEDYYDIFERPHLQEFLDYVFKKFNVGVWTASSKDYAIFVIKNFIIQPQTKMEFNRELKLFLCSHHCNVSKKHFKGTTKDLKLISDRWNLKNFNELLLIDDLEQLAENQPNNVILIKPFYYDKDESYDDKELLRIKTYLETLN